MLLKLNIRSELGRNDPYVIRLCLRDKRHLQKQKMPKKANEVDEAVETVIIVAFTAAFILNLVLDGTILQKLTLLGAVVRKVR